MLSCQAVTQFRKYVRNIMQPLSLSFSLSEAVRAHMIVDVMKSSQSKRQIWQGYADGDGGRSLSACVCFPVTLVTLSTAGAEARPRPPPLPLLQSKRLSCLVHRTLRDTKRAWREVGMEEEWVWGERSEDAIRAGRRRRRGTRR